MENSKNQDQENIKKKIEKNTNLFQYLINIDSYIYEYLYILYLKKDKINELMIIDNYYINFFKQIIKDITINNTSIITKNKLEYENFVEKKICSEVNLEYIKNTSISYLYLYYIITKWEDLPQNIFFYNIDNENTFPIEMYIIPKKDIEILSNNYSLFNFVSDNIILSKKESRFHKKLSFKEWWNKFIKKSIPNVFQYCPELTFSVRRENIKKNGKKYYQDIFNYINQNPYCQELYYLDRCWYYIFL
tara:strand:+ start:337 stop:1077 length:741 start_codon:yes stop_codon:yes gene_type:complete